MLRRQIYNWKLRSIGQSVASACGNPVIIIGMHRSGTSLLTRMLRNAGGYYGSVLEPNSEPPSFIKLNDKLLDCFGLTWYSFPQEICADLQENIAATKTILHNLEFLWDEFFQHYGKSGVEFKKQIGNNPIDGNKGLLFLIKRLPIEGNKGIRFWGWKDPRTTLTLPIWLKMFPDAKIVHVIRNGIDSSLSLWHRCKVNRDGAPYCNDAAYCFKLWERYVEKGISWRKRPTNRYYELHYEDLLISPDEEVRKLISVLGVDIDKAIFVNDMIDKSNRQNYKRWTDYPHLIDCARNSHLFNDLGYSSLLPS